MYTSNVHLITQVLSIWLGLLIKACHGNFKDIIYVVNKNYTIWLFSENRPSWMKRVMHGKVLNTNQKCYGFIDLTRLKACGGGGPGGNPGNGGVHRGGASFLALAFCDLLWGCCLWRFGSVDSSLASADDSASLTSIAKTYCLSPHMSFSFLMLL